MLPHCHDQTGATHQDTALSAPLHANEHKDGATVAGIASGSKLSLSIERADRILKRYLMCIVAGDPRKACFALFQAGDGFGFGLSSTEWIVIGTERG